MIAPWFSIWTRPRTTLRAIVRAKPTFGFWILATLYAVASLFSLANFYSWGLSSCSSPFFLLLVLSPILGIVIFYLNAWVLQWTGSFFKGKAPIWHIRAALAWSKVPYIASLLLWLTLLATNNTEAVFVQAVPGSLGIVTTLIPLTLSLWSLVLLIQGISEVQSFSLGRSIANVLCSEMFVWLIILISAFIIRYAFIGTVSSFSLIN